MVSIALQLAFDLEFGMTVGSCQKIEAKVDCFPKAGVLRTEWNINLEEVKGFKLNGTKCYRATRFKYEVKHLSFICIFVRDTHIHVRY